MLRATGGSIHLAAELFKSMARRQYRSYSLQGHRTGSRRCARRPSAGDVCYRGSAAPHIKSGKLRALAVTSAQPSALAPGLPTVAASGLPGYEAVGIIAMYAPAKTPAAIIKRLNQEIVRVLNQADVKEKFLNAGSEPTPSSPEGLAAKIKAEIAKWGKLIKEAGIKTD